MRGGPWSAVGRDAIVRTLVSSLRGDGPPVHLLHGVWGAGTSRVLTEVAGQLARHGRPVRQLVADDHLSGDDIALAAGEATLVIDDAHRLDREATEVLRDLALTSAVRAVLGVRAGAELPEALGWLDTSGLAPRCEVPVFDTGSVGRVVASRLGDHVHRGAIQTLTDLTGGRPALVVDLVDRAVETGAILNRNGLWRLSGQRLPTDLVERRLARELRTIVAPPAAAAHAVLALAGPLRPDVAAEAVGRGPLDELFRAGHVGVAKSGEVTVVPPIAATASLAAMPPGSASEAARTLMARAGEQVPAAQRVRWARLAGDDVPDDVLGEAARTIWRDLSPRAALELVEPSLDQPELGLLAAELLQELGDRTGAVEVLASVEAMHEAPERVRLSAALERATILLWDLADARTAEATIAAQADLVPAERRPQIEAALGGLRLFSGAPVEATRRLAPLVDHPEWGTDAESLLAAAWAVIGNDAKAVGLGRIACETAPDADPPTPTVALTLALSEGGRLSEAHLLAEKAYRRALDGTRSAQAWTALCRLRVALVTGHLEEATQAGLEAAELFADLDQHATLRWATAGRIIAAASVGAAEEAARLLRDLDELGPSAVRFLEPDVVRARAWAAAAAGDMPRARQHAADAADMAQDMGALALASSALHDLVRLGGDAVPALCDVAQRTSGRWGPVRAAHAVAAAEGNAEALLDVSDQLAEMGAVVPAAEAAAQALEGARRSGGRHLERRARGVLTRRWARCPDAATPALARQEPSRLTRRELEVAERAAAGTSSRVIAAELGISVRTVDNLLQRAYAKLGIHRRGELRDALSLSR